ncbi:MAG TPA: hypothetical protein DCZ97_17375 [Syntrophus sp. (in: bacteria)]|nr:hypothetical protein [Syntrophus sp. (in: bacteria)]
MKESTARGCRGVLDPHILPAFEHRPLAEITREEIKELFFEKMRAGLNRRPADYERLFQVRKLMIPAISNYNKH